MGRKKIWLIIDILFVDNKIELKKVWKEKEAKTENRDTKEKISPVM